MLRGVFLKKSKNKSKRFWETHVTSRLRRKENIYINKFEIDRYIDEYWFIKCPKELPISIVNERVERLIHEILI